MSEAVQLTCVALGGRGVLIQGAPGSGKSSLALALIDRGAVLVGDDGILLHEQGGRLIAAPHPNITGKLEVRNLGLVDFPVSEPVPVAILLLFDSDAPRFIDAAETVELCGQRLPQVRLWPGGEGIALKAELALKHFGLPSS